MDLMDKKAFSLAEAMVVLVIISILMAVSAPLIAKKAAADQNRAVIVGAGGTIFSAQGANQKFQIGPSGGTTVDRLKIFGKSIFNGNIEVNGDSVFKSNKNGSEDVIFQVKGKDNSDTEGFIVYGDGHTNAGGCMPDYGKIKNIKARPSQYTTPVQLKAENGFGDGYVISTGVVTINNELSFYPSIAISDLQVDGDGWLQYAESIFFGYVIVPVAENDTVKYSNSYTYSDFGMLIMDAGYNTSVGSNTAVYKFVPCK